MEADLENLQAAWEWAVRTKLIGAGASRGWAVYVFLPQSALLRRLRRLPGSIRSYPEPPSQGGRVGLARLSSRLRTWQAALSLNLERFEEAGQFLQESQQILDNPPLDPQAMLQERIFMLVIRAMFANLRFDGAAMLADYEQALQLSQQVNGKSPRILIYYWRFLMGGGSITKEHYLLMEQTLADVQQIGDPFELGCHLFTLGISELYHAYHMENAEPLLKESVTNFQHVEDPSTEVMIIKALGYLLSVQGNFGDSLALKQRELEIVQETGDRRMLGIVQTEIGEIYCHMGDYLRAEAHIRTGITLLQGRSAYDFALRHRYLGDVLLAQGKYP